MGMPWDNNPQQQQPYQYPPQPRPAPPPQPRPAPPPQPRPAQPPAPSVPVVARNQATGESVRVDLGGAIQEAIAQALRDGMPAAQKRALAGRSPKKPAAQDESIAEETLDSIEEAWNTGPVTTRTFVQGMAVDVGFALMATLATVTSGTFDASDKEAWILVGTLMLKTVVQTAISFALKGPHQK